jgi:hypothetical protein
VQAATEPSEDRGKYGTKRAPSRKPYTRTTPLEIVRVLRLHAESVSASEIARIVKLSHQQVLSLIDKHAPTEDKAMAVLKASSYDAAVKWVQSFTHAAKRGEHRPMRDALIAVGVVAPDAQNVGVTVVVGGGDVGAMHQAHSSTSIDVPTPHTEHHNPTLTAPLLEEPYAVRLSEEVDK